MDGLLPPRSDPASVSLTHFDELVAQAAQLYRVYEMSHLRSHIFLWEFLAGLALVIREARRDPGPAIALVKTKHIRASRLEVGLCRVFVGHRNAKRQDQAHRWASAAAYVAHPPHDPPPPTLVDCVQYIKRRGGERDLADLYAANKPEEDWKRYYARQVGSHNEWYSPPYIFDALACRYDLDPASPGRDAVPWIPADVHYTFSGLERTWFGFIWLNPPYGRGVLDEWMRKFAQHGNGVALVPDRTSAGWHQELCPQADLILFLNKNIKFINEKGEETSAFPIGTHLVGIGERAVKALINAHRAGLGNLFEPFHP